MILISTLHKRKFNPLQKHAHSGQTLSYKPFATQRRFSADTIGHVGMSIIHKGKAALSSLKSTADTLCFRLSGQGKWGITSIQTKWGKLMPKFHFIRLLSRSIIYRHCSSFGKEMGIKPRFPNCLIPFSNPLSFYIKKDEYQSQGPTQNPARGNEKWPWTCWEHAHNSGIWTRGNHLPQPAWRLPMIGP